MDDVSKLEICELPFIRKNGSNEFKNEAEERRKSLGTLINKIGFTNARRMHKSLSQQYNISERMIYKDFDWIKGHWKPSDFEEIKIDIRIARDRILSESLMLINTANTFDEKLRAINILIDASKTCREELEAWGEKLETKNSGKHISLEIIQHEPAVFNLIEKSNEEIKKEREEKLSCNRTTIN